MNIVKFLGIVLFGGVKPNVSILIVKNKIKGRKYRTLHYCLEEVQRSKQSIVLTNQIQS
jgi:hypothetical protein